jgi:hypothetical protein
MSSKKGVGAVVISPTRGWRHLIPENKRLVAKRIHRPFVGPVWVSAYPIGYQPEDGLELLREDIHEADKFGPMAGLRHVAALLARQEQRRSLPKEWQHHLWLIVGGTILVDEDGDQFIPYLSQDDDDKWCLDFEPADSDWFDDSDAILRVNPVIRVG